MKPGDPDDRILLPKARVIILRELSNGHYLFRYDIGGTYVGDTWHQSPEDAREQAGWEYGAALSDWTEIPANASDAEAYALNEARELP